MSADNPLRKRSAGSFLMNNSVTILFVLLCIGGFFASGTTLSFLLPELVTRIGRNTFLVLSLIVPVTAGLGLNFGIVVGAISAQIAIFLVLLWGVNGIAGILLCVVLCTPIAIFLGWLVGALFNRMKGAEMIGGLVAGYFFDGLYQFFFLFILGGVIPIVNKTLMIPGGVGVKNTLDLGGSLKYAIDGLPMVTILDVAFYAVVGVSAVLILYRLVKKKNLGLPKILKVLVPVAALYAASYIPAVYKFLSQPRLLLLNAVELGCLVAVLYNIWRIIKSKVIDKAPGFPVRNAVYIGVAGLIYALTYVPVLYDALLAARIPVLPYLLIGALCLGIPWFMDTRLGQNMRTVGQSRSVATSAGINVDRTRIIAMIISTVLASYGQLISLQNFGTVATYGAHVQVGLYAIAALLVGGASVQRATVKQALLGIVLFHTLFILSPIAGKQLLGNAQIGEYFRVFVAYGVIALSLAMHAWSSRKSAAQRREDAAAADAA